MTIGEMIKLRIKELNASHEDVCRGICTVSMLYKVERGEKNLRPENMALILERLGMRNIFGSDIVASENYCCLQTIRQASQQIIMGNYQAAESLLQSIRDNSESFSKATEQRFDMCETLLVEKTSGLSPLAKLDCFEKIIRYTIEDYDPLKLPALLTSTEVKVLNVIGNCYSSVGDEETSIAIHSHLKRYIESTYLDKTEAAKMLGMICYNLSKTLGLQGKYDESIDVAKQGIEWQKSIGAHNTLVSCMYNCAWSMAKRGNPEDKEEAEGLARKALILCEELELRESLKYHIKDLITEHFE